MLAVRVVEDSLAWCFGKFGRNRLLVVSYKTQDPRKIYLHFDFWHLKTFEQLPFYLDQHAIHLYLLYDQKKDFRPKKSQ